MAILRPIDLRASRARLAVLASTLVAALGVPACYGEDGTDPAALDLSPPDPGHGLQLQTPTFQVAAGTERQWCYWLKLPSDVDVDVVRFQIKYLTGSHHMNLYQTNQDVPDHDAECFGPVDFSSPTNPNGYDLIVGSQASDLDWKLPPGIAMKLKAHKQIMIQTHYVNASTQKTPLNVGRVKINLWTEPDATKVTAHMGTMFANNMNVKIPPHEAREFSTVCDLAKAANVVALTGHFHSRGKTFSVNVAPDGQNPTDEIYRSRDWAEPPFTVLDQPRALPDGGGLYYTCSYVNNTDQEVVFGPHVETQEHCNLFAYFYPWEEDHARYCF